VPSDQYGPAEPEFPLLVATSRTQTKIQESQEIQESQCVQGALSPYSYNVNVAETKPPDSGGGKG